MLYVFFLPQLINKLKKPTPQLLFLKVNGLRALFLLKILKPLYRGNQVSKHLEK